jgi:BirA family biotin operon repressor/biotin-[acetyl-CoA-carboxylase] ligase
VAGVLIASNNRIVSPDTLRLGAVLLRFDNTDSTNNTARRLATLGLPQGSVIIARRQRRGRGRDERGWVSPVGGLWFSLVLRLKAPIWPISLLPIAAGVSTVRTIRRIYQLEAVLKWPNDVMIGARKIAGILTESSVEDDYYSVVIGFGINVNNSSILMPSELRDKVISLYDLTKSHVDVEWLMKENLREFAEIYAGMLSGKQAEVVAAWKHLTLMLGKQITVCERNTYFNAVAIDLGPDGALVVRTESGALRRLLSGSILL